MLKIRCKACNNVITVREETRRRRRPRRRPIRCTTALDELPAATTSTRACRRCRRAAPTSPGSADEWYVSFDGEQEGPLPLARALDRVRVERPRGKECFCWRGGFFVWLPIEDVPEFAPALRKLPPPIPAVRPRPATAARRPAIVADGQQPALKSPTRDSSRRCSRRRAQQPALKSPTGDAAGAEVARAGAASRGALADAARAHGEIADAAQLPRAGAAPSGN